MRPPCPHLLVFAVRLLSNVFGFFELHLLDLHLLLVFHGSVLNHLHASDEQKDRQLFSSTSPLKAPLIWGTLSFSHAVTTACNYVYIFLVFHNQQYAYHMEPNELTDIGYLTNDSGKVKIQL